MQRYFAVAMLGGVTFFLVSTPASFAQQQQSLNPQPAASLVAASANLPALPPVPRGKSTVLGGQIQHVDPVRDQLTLKAYGEKPIKILFDERTQVYRDGSRIPLLDLGASDHASVQTILDGVDIFAVSVHILSKPPEGDYQGRVLSYNPSSGEISIDGGIAGQPFKLLVTRDTSIARQGQSSFSSAQAVDSDLERGALISVKFESNQQGRGVARQIAILATPGSHFVFTGEISSLDMHSAFLVLLDPRDGTTYRIFFDPARFPASRDLHVGERLRVNVGYDGTRYMASEIAPY
jgi:hypothetical protein